METDKEKNSPQEPEKIPEQKTDTLPEAIKAGIHTFENDMARATLTEQGVTVKQVIAIEKMKEDREENSSPRSTKNVLFIISGIIVLLLAIGIIGFAFFKNRVETVSVVTPSYKPIVYTDNVLLVPLDSVPENNKKRIFRTTIESLPTGMTGLIELLPTINGKKATLPELEEFGIAIPYTIDATSYLVGVYISNESVSPFILLRVTSHSNAFSVMRRFEETIIDNVLGVFDFKFKTKEEESRVHPFYDAVANNKNIRGASTIEGDEFIFYTFPNDNTLLIAENRFLITEILDRLRSLKIEG